MFDLDSGVNTLRRALIFLILICVVAAAAGMAGCDTEVSDVLPPEDDGNIGEGPFKWRQVEDTNDAVYSIFALDPQHVWVPMGNSMLFFDGESWDAEKFKSQVLDVYAVSPENAWAVGTEGGQGIAGASTIYYYNGDSWEPQHTVIEVTLNKIYAADPQNVWVTESHKKSSKVYYYDGNSWREQAEIDGRVWDISGSGANHVMVCVEDAETGDGIIYFFNGEGWVEQYRVKERLDTVYSLDISHAWAGGFEGGIYSFNGSTWSDEENIKHWVDDITAADKDNVWAIRKSEAGIDKIDSIFYYNGTEWKEQYQASVQKSLMAISAADPANVWAAVGLGETLSHGAILFYGE